jgi:hypothetical protein
MNPSVEIKDQQLHVNFYIFKKNNKYFKQKEDFLTYVVERARDNFSRTTSPRGFIVYIRVTGIPTAVYAH